MISPLVLVLSTFMPLLVPLAPPSPLATLTLLNCVRDANSPVGAAMEDTTERLGPWMLAGLDACAQMDRLAKIGTSTMGLRGGAMIVQRLLSGLALGPLAKVPRSKAGAKLEVFGTACSGSHSAAAARWPQRRASLAPPSGDEFGASSPTRALRPWRAPCIRAALAPCQRIRLGLRRQGLAHRDSLTTSTLCSVTFLGKIAMGETSNAASAVLHGLPGEDARLTLADKRRE